MTLAGRRSAERCRFWYDAGHGNPVVVYPQIKTLERAFGKPGADTIEHDLGPLPKVFPRLAAWCARIEALPGYDATYPPHWREG